MTVTYRMRRSSAVGFIKGFALFALDTKMIYGYTIICVFIYNWQKYLEMRCLTTKIDTIYKKAKRKEADL